MANSQIETANVTKMQRTDGGDGYYTPEPIGGTATYQYDNLHRLTYEYFSAQASTIIHDFGYQYYHDSVGNRTKHSFYNWEHDWYYDEYEEQWYPIGDWEDRMTYEYSSRNELTKTTDYQSNETAFLYDLRGNLTKRGATEYYWDSADHMTKVVNGSTTVEYKYDLMGRKVARRKTVSGQNAEPWRWYFYDGLKIIAEGSSTTARTYYTQSPGVIGGVICADGLNFYHYDRLGTLIATSNGAGEVSETFQTTSAFGGSPLFTGKQYDGDAGLYYFNARWYDPSTGRFVSRDPIGNVVAFLTRPMAHLLQNGSYVYCGNNPAKHIDPSGMSPFTSCWTMCMDALGWGLGGLSLSICGFTYSLTSCSEIIAKDGLKCLLKKVNGCLSPLCGAWFVSNSLGCAIGCGVPTDWLDMSKPCPCPMDDNAYRDCNYLR